MLPAKPILGFLLRAGVLLTVLLVRWPGLEPGYAACFRALGGWVFDAFTPNAIVQFRKDERDPQNWDTVIVLGNKRQRDAAGQARAAGFKVNSRSVGYVPTALVVALVLATNLPWRRRLGALAWSLVWVHLYIAFLLELVLLSMAGQNPWLELWRLGPFGDRAVAWLNQTFLTTFQGRRYAVALLIWLLVCFRREDLARFRPPAETPQQPAPA